MEEIKNIINNEKIGNTFFNLYDRWRDECEFEDINEYGKVIANVIATEYPSYDVKLVQSMKRPFGVKINVCGLTFKVWVKLRGLSISLCASKA